jgi:hypothetical protein
MNQSPSWEGNSDSTSQRNFPTFYGTRKFITVFTRARHWSLSRSRWIQVTPLQPISLRFILILSSHLHLGSSSGLFHSDDFVRIFPFPMRANAPPISYTLIWHRYQYVWKRTSYNDCYAFFAILVRPQHHVSYWQKTVYFPAPTEFHSVLEVGAQTVWFSFGGFQLLLVYRDLCTISQCHCHTRELYWKLRKLLLLS